MDVGIGLPNAVRGVDRAGIVDWAKEAEQAGFASLGTIDRLVYPNYESLVVLAAAAAVTERVRLVTDILIAPLRSNTALLGKQAATIDSLSGGRLTLGLAVGGRQDDFEVSGVDFHTRGRTFEGQLNELRAVWRQERGVGPAPARNNGPTVLVGGYSEMGFKRAARYGDGWTMGGGTPDQFAEALEQLNAVWSEAGREGKPRTLGLMYFSLGPDGERAARENLGDYYAWLGELADQIVAGSAKDADTVRQYLAGFEATGCDEMICFPASADVGQVELLAEAALR
jgi:alkanesulfonate monooxygenase SsuD/methylene tetrahydromethanopterin reductase-like flavin-dependent oxidoreductase (luciferase family)